MIYPRGGFVRATRYVIHRMSRLPDEPHRIARYLEALASTYHRFYDACRVLPRGDEDLSGEHLARLWLCAATRQVIANGLGLLGVGAPERM